MSNSNLKMWLCQRLLLTLNQPFFVSGRFRKSKGGFAKKQFVFVKKPGSWKTLPIRSGQHEHYNWNILKPTHVLEREHCDSKTVQLG